MNKSEAKETLDLIPDDVYDSVGSVLAVAEGEASRRDWQRWAVAVEDHNPLWFEPEFAREHGYKDVICPPLYLQNAVLGVTPLDQLRKDGSLETAAGKLSFPKAPRRMAGGESHRFYAPVYDRDHIVMERRLEAVEEKQGRSGNFVVITWQTVYTNQHDELVAETTTSIIARP